MMSTMWVDEFWNYRVISIHPIGASFVPEASLRDSLDLNAIS